MDRKRRVHPGNLSQIALEIGSLKAIERDLLCICGLGKHLLQVFGAALEEMPWQIDDDEGSGQQKSRFVLTEHLCKDSVIVGF